MYIFFSFIGSKKVDFFFLINRFKLFERTKIFLLGDENYEYLQTHSLESGKKDRPFFFRCDIYVFFLLSTRI